MFFDLIRKNTTRQEKKMEIISRTTTYKVDVLVGKTPDYNVYIVNVNSSEQYLLKIAATSVHNGLLDREAFLLSDIHKEFEFRNAEHKARNKTDHGLGYQRCFPRLVESFVVPEQGQRRVNVIAIYGALSVKDLVPLEQYRTRASARIDPKSSAWIMGRLLKIFTLTHPMGVAAGKIDGGNILTNPTEHHVVLFDWTRARYHDGALLRAIVSEEISQAAHAVILALGGNPATGELPKSEQLPDSRYADYLKRMADGGVSDAVSAGAQFYELLGTLWKPSFHPFTTIPM
jgi:hypothetical protein